MPVLQGLDTSRLLISHSTVRSVQDALKEQSRASSSGGPVPDEQPGRVFVGEGGASAPLHRPGSINLEHHISSVITDVTDGRNEAPVEVVKQADLLRKVCLHCTTW